MLVIKRVSENMFDVFWGTGWNNWCRFSRQGKHLKKMGGMSVPEQEMKEVWNAKW